MALCYALISLPPWANLQKTPPPLPFCSPNKMSSPFNTRKAAILASIGDELIPDKSPKGSLDTPIVGLIRAINAIPHIVTTSSCSGRVAVFQTVHATAGVARRSKRGLWRLVVHGKVTFDQVLKSLTTQPPSDRKTTENEASEAMAAAHAAGGSTISEFRFEPFILSVECENMQVATKFLQVALGAGFRESGLTSVSRRIMLSVRCSIRLETAVMRDNKMLVANDYLQFLVDEANRKMDLNIERIQRFFHDMCVSFELDAASFLDKKERELYLASATTHSQHESKSHSDSDAKPHSIVVHTQVSAVVVKGLLKHKYIHNGFKKKADRTQHTLTIPLTAQGYEVLQHICTVQELLSEPVLGMHNVPLKDEHQEQLVATEPVKFVHVELDANLSRGDKRRMVRAALQATASADADSKSTALAAKILKNDKSPAARLRRAVQKLLQESKLDWPDNLTVAQLAAHPDVPRKWETIGDIVLLPATAFTTHTTVWDQLDQHELWTTVAEALGFKRVVRQQEVAENLLRESRASLLLGDNGWAVHRENGIWYELDVTKSMFSSGNGTEKKRVIELCNAGDVVVDLYAGVGYFTLPYLIHGGASQVYACEWNPNSVEALNRAVKRNRVDKRRITIYQGDNRQTNIVNVADRVNLGLLPSSEDGWPLAIRALKPQGGWMHVHANVRDTSMDQWQAGLLNSLTEISRSSEHAEKTQWVFSIHHVEVVKSYAPHVNHIVADVHCGPPAPQENDSRDQNQNQNQNQVLGSSNDGDYDEKHTAAERGTVPILENVTPDTFALEVYPRRKPVVLCGLDLGDAPSKWTPDYLATTTPSKRQASVHVCPDERLSFVDRNFVFKTMPYSEMVQRLAGDTKELEPPYFISPKEQYYLRTIGNNPRKERADFVKQFPKLAKDFKFPNLLESHTQGRYFSSVFRISSKGMHLWTHYDITDNFLCHVTGRKRVVLFPPEDVANLYVETSSSPILDIDEPDLSRWPRFRYAQPIECVLEPGDVLFIPALWFHNVKTLEFAVSVNLFWRHLPDEFYEQKDLYANKDLPLGESMVQHTIAVAATAKDIPKYYREFYLRKSMMRLLRDDQAVICAGAKNAGSTVNTTK
jgi:tRNA wybutosine-synthesizing protein 5